MSNNVQDHLPKIVSIFPDLADLPEEEWRKAGIDVKKLEPAQTIPEGIILDYAVFILDGRVRMYKVSESGREITLYRISDGECCPLMSSSILGGTEYEASASVETHSLALFIPTPIFREWFDTYKSFRQFIFQSICGRILTLSKLLDNINFKSIRSRVVEYLLEQAEGNVIKTTHDTLAIELGSVREVISRTLKQLEKDQYIALTRGKIMIVDRAGLEELVE